MKRVVVTGIGAVTPLAASFRASWKMIKAGMSGIGPLTRVEPDNLFRKAVWRAAGEITDFRIDAVFSKKEGNHIDPFVSYAVSAALESFEDAGLMSENKRVAVPCGIILGSSRGGISTLEREFAKISSYRQDGKTAHRVSPFLMPTTTISAAGAYVGAKLGITGYMLGISNACASGAAAIGEAFLMITKGCASVLIAGGTEAPICRLCIEGYGSTGALSDSAPDEASRPFDVKRNGFVLAEGACMLVIEELEHAINRNAIIHAEIIGYGNICDASHLTLPSVKGESLAISKALADAAISPEDVDYINTHGTSTPAGDRTEAAAIRKVFGDRPVPVNAIKSMTGHMLAASGAFEAACTAMSLKEGFIPPTINTRNIDPDCVINLITEAADIPIRTAVTSSFGFGGVNSVLTLRRFSE
jgi:3-oxoacyl-[acyl-carrier-protein] synthase II